jgi:uncharacterized protein (TIGR03663 family)
MKQWVTPALALLAIAAALLRWPMPDQRPMHNDEAVNGIKFGRLWEQGQYHYDPNEHHGPTLYYITAAVSRVTGAPSGLANVSETRLRWVTVLFGLGLICLLPLLKDALGRSGVLWTGIFTAVSPAFVFYSQYYIHEMLLVFFTLGVMGCGWRYWQSRKPAWAVACGVFGGLMAATKETFVMSLAAGALALALNQVWNRALDATVAPVKTPPVNPRHVGLGLGAALLTAVLFFSSFFTNASGPLDAIRSYAPWLARAGGDSPHLHPWHFYAERLLWFHAAKGPIWSEGLIAALALVGMVAGFRRRGLGDARAGFLRFLTFYSLALAGIYSLIPYKTPWCLLNFWHGFVLLAGVGAAWLIANPPRHWQRAAIALVLMGGATHLAWQANRSVNILGAVRKNPYVYAQTLPNILKLTERVHELAGFGDGRDTVLKVISPNNDYWPLPWHFRDFNQIGWWDALPEDPYAPVMVVSAKLGAALDENGTHLMIGYFELRPGVFLELYVEMELWKKYLAERK